MSNLPIEIVDMLGQTLVKVLPVTLVLALVFSVLSHFWACNPGKSWWQKRELVTDICYWFFVPVFARVLRIGLLVVVQNVFTSLFNSHLFDFHEGWMYVIGVGVAGGMVIRAQQAEAKMREAGS